MIRDIKATLVVFITALLLAGCGTLAGNPDDDAEKSQDRADIPDARGINLVHFGASPTKLSLASEEDCAGALRLGVFGVPVYVVCKMSLIAGETLYGEDADRNNDGRLNCDDFGIGTKNQGLLFPLLCDPKMFETNRIESFRYQYKGNTYAVSFADFLPDDKVTAVGTWTASGPDSGRYPANIRAWKGTTGATLNGLAALNLNGIKEGSMYLDFRPSGGARFGEITYSIKTTVDSCIKAPSVDNCHWEEFEMKGPEENVQDTFPSGMHYRVLANGEKNPDWILVEGKMHYSAEAMQKAYDDSNKTLPPEITSVTECYFRIVQQGRQIWGSFDFKGADGNTISMPTTIGGVTFDMAQVLRDGSGGVPHAGVCENLGVNRFVACTDIRYSDYDSVWIGDDKFTGVPVDYAFPTGLFDGAPSKDGLLTK